MIPLTKPQDENDSAIAVEAVGVVKSYARGNHLAPVLRGADLAVRAGECVYLVGPSGSGKTTLLSILGCILGADGGRVRVLGEDLDAMSVRERIVMRRDRLGFVFQRFHLIRGLTALDNVCVPLLLRGASHRAAQRRAASLLESVGLEDKAQSHPRQLSAGQCQRVAMARALAGDPELILADEPTASLDAAAGQEAMQLLRRLTTGQGRTAVVVTHDPRIFSFADRIFRLDGGRVVETLDGPQPAAPSPSLGSVP